MKTVFSSHSEVCHIWAQQKQQSGRAGNIFFEGDSIYSYGTHYKAARFVRPNVVFINSTNYSVSTQKHLSLIKRAIPGGITEFYTKNPDYHPIDVYNEYLQKLNSECINQDFSRKKVDSIRWAIGESNNLLDKMKSIKSVFNLDLDIVADLAFLWNWQDKCKSLISEKEKRAAELDKRTPEQKAKDAEKRELYKQRREEKKQRELAAKHKVAIEEWLNFGRYSLPYEIKKVYLRQGGNMVQTSKGAQVPVNAAYRLYKDITNSQFKPNEELGNYTTRSWDGKTLVIGCHQIELDEIQRFAKVMGW